MTGECYNDSAYDESVTFNDGAPDSARLTVAEGHRHDGTAGTGARIVASGKHALHNDAGALDTIEWLEWDQNGQQCDGPSGKIIRIDIATTIQRMLVHGAVSSSTSAIGISRQANHNGSAFHNNIIYNLRCTNTGGGVCEAFRLAGGTGTYNNNTAFNITNHNGTGQCTGYVAPNDDAASQCRNNIAIECNQGSTSGTKQDFDSAIESASTTIHSHNLSSDTSAPGLNSLTEKLATDNFISTVSGSEDLHLKSGADATAAGIDPGVTPTGVNIDIDGRDRDAQGDIWDIGADQSIALALVSCIALISAWTGDVNLTSAWPGDIALTSNWKTQITLTSQWETC